MFYSFLGDITQLSGRYQDKPIDFFILINNSHEKDSDQEWKGFIQTIKYYFSRLMTRNNKNVIDQINSEMRFEIRNVREEIGSKVDTLQAEIKEIKDLLKKSFDDKK